MPSTWFARCRLRRSRFAHISMLVAAQLKPLWIAVDVRASCFLLVLAEGRVDQRVDRSARVARVRQRRPLSRAAVRIVVSVIVIGRRRSCRGRQSSGQRRQQQCGGRQQGDVERGRRACGGRCDARQGYGSDAVRICLPTGLNPPCCSRDIPALVLLLTATRRWCEIWRRARRRDAATPPLFR